MTRPPLPPFTQATAARKVRAAEDAWNSRDPTASGATGRSFCPAMLRSPRS
jgi:nuclear transport factor 2 (NTF2) superfamily protein